MFNYTQHGQEDEKLFIFIHIFVKKLINSKLLFSIITNYLNKKFILGDSYILIVSKCNIMYVYEGTHVCENVHIPIGRR